MYAPGDIILGSFPFTDQEAAKNRMFLVVAIPNNHFVWGVMITKEENLDRNDGSIYIINDQDIDFKPSYPSVFRMNILQTVSVRVVTKKMGSVNQDCLDRVLYYIRNVFGFEG